MWCIGGILGSEPSGREFDSLHPDLPVKSIVSRSSKSFVWDQDLGFDQFLDLPDRGTATNAVVDTHILTSTETCSKCSFACIHNFVDSLFLTSI